MTINRNTKLLFSIFSKNEKTYFYKFKNQLFKENKDLTFQEYINIYQPIKLIWEYYKKAIIVLIKSIVSVCLWSRGITWWKKLFVTFFILILSLTPILAYDNNLYNESDDLEIETIITIENSINI